MAHSTSGTDLAERLQTALGSGYTVKEELGGGGMSRVFGVRDIALSRDIVVKVLPPELAGELSAERFKREIQFAASLQHPHIVPVHAAGDADGLPYYTMPRVDGESLRDHLTRRQRLSVNEALTILRDIARALSYAHRRGIVHRDIKPDNVLVADNMAVVTDFGIAKAIAAAREDEQALHPALEPTRPGLTMTGTSLGTPAYMAPEQVAGDPGMDHRVDLYALGVVGYELLAGRPPFHGRTPREQLTAQMSERPRDLAQLRLDLPPAVSGLIMRALEKDPSERPESAEVMMRELDAALTGSAAPVSADEPEVIRRAFGWYVVSFIAAAGIAWTAMQAMGLPDWVFPGAIALMALGLPVVAFTALARYAAYQAASSAPHRSGSQWLGTRSLWAAQYLNWRRVTIGGVSSLGGFGILVAGVMVTRSMGIGPAASLLGKGSLQEQERLLVTEFTSSGVDSSLGAAATIAARSGLMQSRAVSVLSGEVVEGALSRMRRPRTALIDLALGRELAQREGLRIVVAGHLVRAGSGFDVGLRLVSADSGRELASVHRLARNEEEILPTVDALTRDLRGRIGESLKAVRSTPPLPQVTSSSIRALELYAEANKTGDVLKALAMLKEAVAIDTEFAMAYRKIWTMRAFQPDGDSAAKKAVQYRDRLSERERLAVDGAHYTALYLFPDANRNRAVAAYEQLAAMGDPLGMNNLPDVLNSMRQYARAESLDQINVAKFPHIAGMREGLVHRLIELNRLDEAEVALDSALKRFPQSWGLQWWKVRTLYYRGHLDAYERAIDSLSRDPDLNKRRIAMSARADMAFMRGRLRERELLSAEARKLTAAAGLRVGSQTPLARAKTDLDYAITTGKDVPMAVKRVEELQALEPPPTDPQSAFNIVAMFAFANRPDIGRRYLERFIESRPQIKHGGLEGNHFIHWGWSFIKLGENKPREAIEERWQGDRFGDGFPGPCHLCLYRDLGWSYDKLGDADSTILLFEKFVNEPSLFTLQTHPGDVHNYLRRLGELYEQKGNRPKAIEYYNRFVELWKNADPELQPQVADIRARLVRLRS